MFVFYFSYTGLDDVKFFQKINSIVTFFLSFTIDIRENVQITEEGLIPPLQYGDRSVNRQPGFRPGD